MNRLHAALIGIAAAIASADAAEIELISAGAARSVLGGIVEDYARTTGNKFNLTVGSTGRLRAIIASGEPADLIIVSAPRFQSAPILPMRALASPR